MRPEAKYQPNGLGSNLEWMTREGLTEVTPEAVKASKTKSQRPVMWEMLPVASWAKCIYG